MVVVKRFGIDFKCKEGCGALTLPPEHVTNSNPKREDIKGQCFSLTHKSGWTISGIIKEDWFMWVNEFTAIHSTIGYVYGNFEDEVMASSEEAFKHFYDNHPPESWDYGDI